MFKNSEEIENNWKWWNSLDNTFKRILIDNILKLYRDDDITQEGLFAIVNVESLDLSGNNITYLDPLDNLKKLRHLNLSYNNNLDLAPLVILKKTKVFRCIKL